MIRVLTVEEKMYYRDTIVAGRTIIRSLKATSRVNTGKQKRAPKQHPTSEAVAKVNFRNAVKILTAKLNHNFKPGDYHIVLTYAGEAPDQQEAKKNLKRFIENMRNYCKKNDIEFKWVVVTEYKHKRIHHHMVMSKVELDIINKYWPHGFEYPVLLDDTGNYNKLAEYLLKETKETFKEESSVQKRRYSTSRNVVMPEVKREKVAGREVEKEIKALKGYYVDQDTVERYEHAILRVQCMEYIMVSLDEQPRLKRWPKGKAVNPREKFKDYEKQVSMDEMFDLRI